MSFPLKLKGRAWINAETFQILRIETDLVEPVPQIELKREHLTVDYHYRRLHEFTNFMLFSVDVGETIKLPTETPPQP